MEKVLVDGGQFFFERLIQQSDHFWVALHI
jgi:hypothetical protein